ncbi:MAG: NAD-dependent epimerase/dehydratase family protein [Actinomycetota bacterium]|nr:NAD-dependent epimerase/dehydratase family protein [Actinomycetota bacterium]
MTFKNIFITGSTGVVGKPLLKKLIDNGHNVFALARSDNAVKKLENQKVEIVTGDLFSTDLNSQLKKINIDAIFHVAGVNKMCIKKPEQMFYSNIEGTKNILKLGNDLKIKKFIYTSSAVTLGEELNKAGNEDATHRGYFLSKYEESKYLAEVEAFKFKKNFEFVSVNPSSVQGPGRVSGTAKLLISTLNKNYPILIKNNISVVDIDDCTEGHYNAMIHGVDNNRYVLNSFQTSSEELILLLKSISSWQGNPIYLPKNVLNFIAPFGDFYGKITNTSPLLCKESANVLTHGHIYDGSKAEKELKVNYTKINDFIKKTVNWLIDEKYINLARI